MTNPKPQFDSLFLRSTNKKYQASNFLSLSLTLIPFHKKDKESKVNYSLQTLIVS